jgi:hypothetical protein
VVDEALDHQHLQDLLEQRALAHEIYDVARVHQIREDMERATARRLQPHFIGSFFLEALKRLGGRYVEREPRRYEIKYVPTAIRNRNSRLGRRVIIQPTYERITFEKELVNVPGKAQAALVCPGHPLLDLTIDLILDQYRGLFKQGTILVNEKEMGEEMRVLFYLEHTIQDASIDTSGKRRIVSRQLQFIELDASGNIYPAGYAPFLDYRHLSTNELDFAPTLRNQPWLTAKLEEQARTYAITQLVPRHLSEVRNRREAQIDKTEAAVNERLTKEISYWDNRAAQIQMQEAGGKKPNTKLNSQKARQRAEELYARLEHRLQELKQERHLSPLPPVVVGSALVVPVGLLKRLQGESMPDDPALFAHETAEIEQRAMQAVMDAERLHSYQPRDVSKDKCGYDIESLDPLTGKLRFIEVKGRVRGAKNVIVTKNEILTALNKPDDFFLAVVFVDGEATETYYIQRPFQKEPDFDATSVIYNLASLLSKGATPVL